jgi:osmotically inducible lipoprotein OsmB
MNTSLISNASAADIDHSVKPAPVIPHVSHVPAGSEDVTIRRDLPLVAPKQVKRGPSLRTPAIHLKHLLAGMILSSALGCGTTAGDRVVSGAGIGAGAGAVLGAITGMGPGTGAELGAAAGAAAGGLTKKAQVNLGKPVWR